MVIQSTCHPFFFLRKKNNYYLLRLEKKRFVVTNIFLLKILKNFVYLGIDERYIAKCIYL